MVRGNRLLAWLAACEANVFGLGEPFAAGETWVARERRLARIYFAIGLTGSGIVGSVGLILLLALAPGRLADKMQWLGSPSDRTLATAVRPEPANVPLRAERLLVRAGIDEMRKLPTPSIDAMASEIGSRSAQRAEPVVAAVKIVPVIVNPQPVPAKAEPKARKAEAPRRQAPGVKANPKTETPSPIAEAAAAEAQSTAAVRPEGLLSLGGPGAEKGGEARPWWRQMWWKLPLPDLQQLAPARTQ